MTVKIKYKKNKKITITRNRKGEIVSVKEEPW